ncbi:uncharacterized protein LOC103168207 isoform X2 [Ornithorhynchus anatinus]|uniref:uncharacterized protein LOC103168207 isoform X2 n=1 Tax=Ornithorhynchus anatinus TaxID=9258 RepID=UPI0010A898FB|nr:uncharacterized protein LOC103168207 isoform X2 [Ornithorhynchus anatinus]
MFHPQFVLNDRYRLTRSAMFLTEFLPGCHRVGCLFQFLIPPLVSGPCILCQRHWKIASRNRFHVNFLATPGRDSGHPGPGPLSVCASTGDPHNELLFWPRTREPFFSSQHHNSKRSVQDIFSNGWCANYYAQRNEFSSEDCLWSFSYICELRAI